MNFSEKFIKGARQWLPSPFSIAIILTFITVLLALLFTTPKIAHPQPHIIQIGEYWEQGFWDLLSFTMQMMLILVLGHVLALTKPAMWLIHLIVHRFKTTASIAAMVSFFTMIVALLNWGLGLIFGAILARKVAELAKKDNRAINYPLIAACGYSGLMVWHGGLSGSATLKVTEVDHFLVEQIGTIPLSETVFSNLNLVACLLLVTIIPLIVFWLGKRLKATTLEMVEIKENTQPEQSNKFIGAEKLDHSKIFATLFALCIIGMAFYLTFVKSGSFNIGVLTLNYINFILFGLGLLLFGSISRFSAAIEEAIIGSAGIMIQFPLYAGIAGIMQHSGLIHVFSDFIVNVSSPATYPLFTFLSSAIVNIFVPSGGGQWAVQGPILAEAAHTLQVPYASAIMAFAYGDQLTNMMQPFWALPLLGITKLKAQDILPYCLFIMLIGACIFTSVLWFMGGG